jgi:hypothetical protein
MIVLTPDVGSVKADPCKSGVNQQPGRECPRCHASGQPADHRTQNVTIDGDYARGTTWPCLPDPT